MIRLQREMEIEGKPAVRIWDSKVTIEEEAIKQIQNTASLPFLPFGMAVMPDAHWGMGSTVGSVIPTEGAIIPAAVGVDIGCGMMAYQTDVSAVDLPDDLKGLRSLIEAAVPHGRTNEGGPGDRGAWHDLRYEMPFPLKTTLERIVDKHPKLARASKRAPNHLGTLGSGNHFIEVCLDETDKVWIMLHSGSRGIGNAIGQYFIGLAKEDMRRWFINLPDADLAYIPTGSPHFSEYMMALGWAQDFARWNRVHMMDASMDALKRFLGKDVLPVQQAVNCHHNYVSEENHFGRKLLVTRKGAISAKTGELGIIPGSMGARSFIVEGLGNHLSFHSCSHGAGRSMSRTQARKSITLEEHVSDTFGVECRKDESTLDESPRAYKSIDAVMASQEDLVKIRHTLRQILCVKG